MNSIDVSFDPMTVPLDHGQLIEASAGTGKTYTITNLCLRLLPVSYTHLTLPMKRIV